VDLTAQPYAKPPFQGVHSQREMAEKMRQNPKAAVPVLESGDVQRWFALNGWNYPVRGTPIKGVGGVQQFFEGMGVSKPPTVSLSKEEMRFTCKYQDVLRAQVTLQTPAKKWVYAHVTSDSFWLKVPQPQIAGPQHANIAFEIDTSLWNRGPLGEGKLTVEANGGQKLTLKVVVEVIGAPDVPQPKATVSAPASVTDTGASVAATPPAATTPTPAARAKTGMKIIPAFITTVLVCLVLRVLLIPCVDLVLRPIVVRSAAEKARVPVADNSPLGGATGWLELPWMSIFATDAPLAAKHFQPASKDVVTTSEFRHYYVSYFVRWFTLATGWIGVLVGVVWVLRRGGGVLDVPWGLIAGAFAGIAASATFAAFFLIVEFVPLALWQAVGARSGFGFLFLWAVLAVVFWLVLGVGLGIVLPLLPPLRRVLVDPFQNILAMALRLIGGWRLGDYWAPA
jgi:hypothetical protein